MYSTQTLEKITIEPTSYCNARCPQCDRFDEKNNLLVPLRHLDLGVLKQRLDPGMLPNLQKVEFEGNCGDVLSHNNPLGLVYLYRDVRQLMLVTNGSIRNVDFFRELAKFPNMELWFSVDGLQDTNHLYRQDCDFDKIMANADAYIQAGGKATWKFIVFRHNQHQVDQARELSEKMGFRNFSVIQSDRSWHHGNKWPVYNRGKYQFDLEPSDEVNEGELQSDHRQLGKDLSNLYRTHRSIKRCPQSEAKSIFVDHKGHVIPCCMLSIDFWRDTNNTPLLRKYLQQPGSINLNHHSMDEIFESDFYQRDLPRSLAHQPMPTCIQHCAEAT